MKQGRELESELQRLQSLLDEQGESIRCAIENGELVVTNNLIIKKPFSAALPMIARVSGWVEAYKGSALELPALQSAGGVEAHEGSALTLPALQSVSGGVRAHEGSALTLPADVRTAWGKASGDMHKDVLYADGIYSLVKPPRKTLGVTVYEPGCIGALFVVFDGEMWSHGDSLKKALRDLQFKKATAAGADAYKQADRNEQRTIDDLVIMYRIITGACEAGCRMFVSQHAKKETYSIAEAIELAVSYDAYGSKAFSQFFEGA